MNSRAKGCAGEREFRDVLRDAGFRARRGQQFSGSPDSPDVVCPDLPSLHFEIKRVQQVAIWKWMQQAAKDAGDKMPIVAHRRNGEDWLITMRVQDWLTLIKESDRVASRPKPNTFSTPYP